MARICEVCNKGYHKANLVPTGIGGRVTRRTIKRQQPNLRNKRLEINGKKVRVTLCASCLKRYKYNQKAQQTSAE